MPSNHSKFEYYTLVIAEGKEEDQTSSLKIGDTLNFIKVQREHLMKSK